MQRVSDSLSRFDLLDLIGRDVTLRYAASTNGGEYAGACPFCGEGDDRFRVWNRPTTGDGRGRWWCRICEASGDAIDYVRKRDGATFTDACKTLSITPGKPSSANNAKPKTVDPSVVRVPSQRWQERAYAFIDDCLTGLWESADGKRGLAYLYGRGFTDDTLLRAGIGFNPTDRSEQRALWGLSGDKFIWLPRGIVIPTEHVESTADGSATATLFDLRIRRASGDPKYVAVSGGGNALYGGDRASPRKPVQIFESAFDAMLIRQVAGGYVTPVATHSTHGAHHDIARMRLTVAPRVLVSMDGDEPGRKAAKYWCELPNAVEHLTPSTFKDAGDLWNTVGDAGLRDWVLAGLGHRVHDDTYDSLERLAIQAER